MSNTTTHYTNINCTVNNVEGVISPCMDICKDYCFKHTESSLTDMNPLPDVYGQCIPRPNGKQICVCHCHVDQY